MRSIVLITLLVFAAFVSSSASKGRVSDLLDKLDDLLIDAYSQNNLQAIEVIEDAKETLIYAVSKLSEADDELKVDLLASIDDVADDLPGIEIMVARNIKSRSWFKKTFKFLTSKSKTIASTVTKTLKKVQESGLGGFLAVFQPFIDKLKESSQFKMIADGLNTLELAIDGLNKMTGGHIGPLNILRDILANIDTAGEMFEKMTSPESSENLANSLIKTLQSSKSSNLQKITKGIGYVCNGINDIESESIKNSA